MGALGWIPNNKTASFLIYLWHFKLYRFYFNFQTFFSIYIDFPNSHVISNIITCQIIEHHVLIKNKIPRHSVIPIE